MLFEHTKRQRRNAISPIIATLLLILIAIAAGVVVYAYVLGFVGNSTGNSGNNISVISIDNFCAAKTTNNCGTGNQYSVVVRNVGSVSISITSGSVEPALYFTDVTSGSTATATCTASTATVSPGSTYTCASTWPAGFSTSAGDTVTVKVVNPDGGQASSTGKSLG
jgi:flagellin-like protein